MKRDWDFIRELLLQAEKVFGTKAIQNIQVDISSDSEEKYRNGFTYLNYHWRIRSMIHTTNWIERLNRSFRRVLKMRLSMPDEESVLVLLGTVARNQRAYGRRLVHMDKEKTLFPQQSNSP